MVVQSTQTSYSRWDPQLLISETLVDRVPFGVVVVVVVAVVSNLPTIQNKLHKMNTAWGENCDIFGKPPFDKTRYKNNKNDKICNRCNKTNLLLVLPLSTMGHFHIVDFVVNVVAVVIVPDGQHLKQTTLQKQKHKQLNRSRLR